MTDKVVFNNDIKASMKDFRALISKEAPIRDEQISKLVSILIENKEYFYAFEVLSQPFCSIMDDKKITLQYNNNNIPEFPILKNLDDSKLSPFLNILFNSLSNQIYDPKGFMDPTVYEYIFSPGKSKIKQLDSRAKEKVYNQISRSKPDALASVHPRIGTVKMLQSQ